MIYSFQENGSRKFNNNNNISNNWRITDVNSLELPEEIWNNFFDGLLNLYDKLISFLNKESSSIENGNQVLNKQENINNDLKI
jgi:hypothetical protein